MNYEFRIWNTEWTGWMDRVNREGTGGAEETEERKKAE